MRFHYFLSGLPSHWGQQPHSITAPLLCPPDLARLGLGKFFPEPRLCVLPFSNLFQLGKEGARGVRKQLCPEKQFTRWPSVMSSWGLPCLAFTPNFLPMMRKFQGSALKILRQACTASRSLPFTSTVVILCLLLGLSLLRVEGKLRQRALGRRQY